jgi:hypothetical protein
MRVAWSTSCEDNRDSAKPLLIGGYCFLVLSLMACMSFIAGGCSAARHLGTRTASDRQAGDGEIASAGPVNWDENKIPIGAARRLAAALMDGDAEAAARVSHAPDEAQRTVIKVIARLVHADKRFHDALVRRYGETVEGVGRISAYWTDLVERGELTVAEEALADQDEAHSQRCRAALLTPKGGDGDVLPLRETSAGWKVDMVAYMIRYNIIPLEPAMANAAAMEATTEELAGGKHRSAAEALKAAKNRLPPYLRED